MLKRFKHIFKDADKSLPSASYLFNYKKIWKIGVVLIASAAVIPLIIITFADYRVTRNTIKSEFFLIKSRLVSNTQRSISFLLAERKAALEFVAHDNNIEDLKNPERRRNILINLKKSFEGGFVDIGLIDMSGKQNFYEGPYELKGKDYGGQKWFKEAATKGVVISDVFLGYRHVPHLTIAVKKAISKDEFYILRASISIDIFDNILSKLELDSMEDVLIINHEGSLQTSSRYYGKVFQKLSLDVPSYSYKTRVLETYDNSGKESLFIGYRFIENTPFILMIISKKRELMKVWHKSRLYIFTFLMISLIVILTIIIVIITRMVSNIRIADEKRLMAFHEVEYANKMVSIGRMAASIAHEINNPLAIINEKAGLMKDFLVIKKLEEKEAKFESIINSIISSVTRAGKITKRLLSFARNLEASIEDIEIETSIREVLSFIEKEIEYKGIAVNINIDRNITIIKNYRGKLEQIFLNIINNALTAMDNGGSLDIIGSFKDSKSIAVKFIDTGCGIPSENLEKIFEPFFSTYKVQGGTGLGLSITYKLVHEIGGEISVESEVNKGTCFTVTLPLDNELHGE